MGITIVSAVVCVAGCLLTLLSTWIHERCRQTRVLKAVCNLPMGSVYLDEESGVRIKIGCPPLCAHEVTRDR